MKKRLGIGLFFLMPLIIFSQNDTSKIKKSFSISLIGSNGFYDIKKINILGYNSKGLQISMGVLGAYKILPKLKFGIGIFYTEDKFYFQGYNPAAHYYEYPSMEKKMAYLDVIFILNYCVIERSKFSICIETGYSTGRLVKGKNELNSIYGPNYPYYSNNALPYEFNRNVNSFIAGLNLNYKLFKHFSVELSPLWRHFLGPYEWKSHYKIAINGGTPPFINLLIGVNYNF